MELVYLEFNEIWSAYKSVHYTSCTYNQIWLDSTQNIATLGNCYPHLYTILWNKTKSYNYTKYYKIAWAALGNNAMFPS